MEDKDNTTNPSQPSPQSSEISDAPTVAPSNDSTEESEIRQIGGDEVLLLEYPGYESSSSISSQVRIVQFGPHRPDEGYKSWNYYSTKSDTGFVGLSNQGATCYMNSLLQTLYMTPEFRKALYQWEYLEETEGPKEDSIPYQLQNLFAYLQLTSRAAVETKGLTKSFGWGMGDAFEQHDIQELNRVLFDALEKSFKGTELYNIINELYQGTMADRIVCKECGHTISRVDQFLDIPLVIRNISSVEEALEKFIEDETLDGDNAFFCEKCEKKCAVLKGFKFQEFPYLLTLQLKRFDIDFESENMDRIKLNNRVNFPRYIDMSKFLMNNPNQQSSTSDQTSTESTESTPNQPTPTEQPPTELQSKQEEQVVPVVSEVSNFDPSKYQIQDENSVELIQVTQNDDNNSESNKVNEASEGNEANGVATPAPTTTTTTTEIQIDFCDDEDDEDEDMDDDDEFNDDELNSITSENFNTISELMRFLRFYKKNKKNGINFDLTTAAATFLSHTRANAPANSSSSSPSSNNSSSVFSNNSSSLYEPEDSLENIPKGDYIYELYSILIHSGSAQGGHYFAYVKSLQTRKWYKFDDSNVTLLKKGEIESSFGGGKNAWGSSTNAYMLVYRKVNNRNVSTVSDDEVTASIRQQIQTENQLFEEERIIERQKKDKINVNIFWDRKSQSVATDRNHTLEELIKTAYETFELNKREGADAIKIENTRVRSYDSHRNIPSDDFGNQTAKTLRELGINDHASLLLETREDGAEWPRWSKSDSTIHIYAYNEEKGEHDAPFTFGFDKTITLKEFKEAACKLIPHYSHSNIRVFEVTMNISELMGDHKKMYNDFRIITGDKIYVEPESKQLLATGDFFSPTKEWFKRTKDTIVVKFNLPGSTEYNQSVSIDQKSTLRELKLMIESVLGVPSDEFKLKRASNLTSSEYKELDRSLFSLNINGNVLVELGAPLRRDQHFFKLMKYHAETSKFENISDLVVEEGMKIDSIIRSIAEKLDLDHTLIRLRDKIGNKVTKIFKRNLTLKESIPCCYDGRELVFEIIKEYREIKDDENLVLIARYFPKENKLGEYTEVVIKNDISLWNFQNLVKSLADESLPIENISISKPFTTFSLLTSDTKTLTWKRHQKEEDALLKLTEYRWFVYDGDIFFYKDIAEDPPIDEVKYNIDGEKSNSSSGFPADFFKPVVVQRARREEKALKIKTRYDADENKKKVEEKKEETTDNNTNNNNNNNNHTTDNVSTADEVTATNDSNTKNEN